MLSLINNLASMNAQANLGNATNALNTSLQRLSSGLQINSGADNPAGLVISQVQQAQMSGLQAAITNTSNATNVVQTADGGLNEINSLLVQIRGLAVSAANSGANDPNMLAADQAQIANALQTITGISTSTQYGSEQLLNGSHAANVALTGASAGDTASISGDSQIQSGTYTVAISQAATATNVTGGVYAAPTSAETIAINGVQVQIGANSTLAQAQAAINGVSTQSGVAATLDPTATKLVLYSNQFGSGHNINVTQVSGSDTGVTGLVGATVTAGQNAVASISGTINGQAINQTLTGIGNVINSNSGATAGLSITFAPATASGTMPYQTADAAASTPITSFTATVNTSNALLFQIGANAGQTASVAIQSVQANALGQGANNNIANLSAIDVTSTQSSSDILSVIDKAISDVSKLAGTLGAFQDNTLQATAANLQTSLQNTTAANSTIRDTNFAQASAQYAQNQVLVQAGTQVLKNANQLPQLALTLLQ